MGLLAMYLVHHENLVYFGITTQPMLLCIQALYIIFLDALFHILQEIPQSKPWEKVSGPPILPPHLLQVILNKDTPLSVSKMC